MFNLAVILRESATASPGKPAIRYDGGQMTYAELDAASDAVAEGLTGIGVGPGTAVGLQLPNIPQFVVAYFGILKAGGVVVPLNPLFKAREVAYHPGRLRPDGDRLYDHIQHQRREPPGVQRRQADLGHRSADLGPRKASACHRVTSTSANWSPADSTS